MVPLFRLGLAPFFSNPVTGYMMVMKTIGRKSGNRYYTPVNYAIHNGYIYCMSGGRRKSDWYKNLLASPEIEVILPGGAIFARVEEVENSIEKQTVARIVLINAGFAGFFEGYNPHRISNEELQEKTANIPMFRFTPIGIGNGASDPAGWAWVWMWILGIIFIWMVVC